MLTFLREVHIRTKIESSNGKPYDTSGVMIQIHGGFSRQCTVWKLFHKLYPLLTDLSWSRHLLTPDHHCLLFEDFLALCPGTEVALLLQFDHLALYDKTWQPLLKRALENNPIVTKTIVGKRFFVFETIVQSNHHADKFANSTLTESKIHHICSYCKGSAIRLDVVGTNDHAMRLHALDFFYNNFLHNIDTVQFWKVHPTSHISAIKASFHGISIKQCSAITSRYFDELMGDATQCGLLVSYFQQFLAAKNYKELSLVTAEDTMSSRNAINSLHCNFQ